MLEVRDGAGLEAVLRVPLSAHVSRRLPHLHGSWCPVSQPGLCANALHQAMEFLPAPTLRRILRLQNELVARPSETSRALLSSSFTPAPSGTATPKHPKEASSSRSQGITSGSTATDLLLGVTGRNKLIAAGDRLRELIYPDALAQAVSVMGAGVGVTGSGSGKKGKLRKERDREDGRAEAARKELDELVAGVCPLCEGAVVGLDKPFVAEGEDVGDWAL